MASLEYDLSSTVKIRVLREVVWVSFWLVLLLHALIGRGRSLVRRLV
jgi:hypothetical protein